MMILDIGIWFQTLIKQFFFSIDQIVFGFISSIYDLLISIARTSVLTQSDIIEMADKIYTLLTVFMVFKVTLSLITYVVNPDDFSDKTKGVSKLGVNIIISLALLILTPYIFSMAYELQTIILEDNSLATLIFETESTASNDENASFLNTAGDIIAYNAMMPFFTPNVSITQLQNCIDLTDDQGNFNSECSGVTKSGTTYTADTSKTNSLIGLKNNGKLEEKSIINYVAGVENKNFGLMFRLDMAVATAEVNDETVFVMDYKYIFSTIVGVVIILLLLNFCLDVAVRSIKLAFLQLIAPIPILSYVDPKSGKDGMFKKWYQMCFSTYLSLFIRLLALYFGVYIISKVDSMTDIIDGSTVTNWLIKIFVIIGALMFAKQFPKILEGLGLKIDSGSFNLNPLRKIEKEALGGGILKKPNDALAKFGKNVAMSPIKGVGTGAKKLIAGADAVRNGKKFSDGSRRVRGDLGKWMDKQRENFLPYSHEAAKKRKEGREEVGAMSRKWSDGNKIWEKMINAGYNDSNLDGLNSGAYTAAGFNGHFLESKMNLDKSGERKKLLTNLSRAAATNSGGLAGAISELSESEKLAYSKYGIGLDGMTSSMLETELDKESKRYSGLESVHESMRKQDQKQAAIEDQLKFVKYNPIDPTSGTESVLEKKKREANASTSSSSSSSSDSSSSSSSSNSSSSSSSSTQSRTDTPSTPSVKERVEHVTGVDRESASDNGAPTADDSALVDFFESNDSAEEKERRVKIDNRMTEIKREIEQLKSKRSITPDSDEYHELTRKIKALNEELENLRRQ